MKKLASCLLIGAALLSLTGCNQSKQASSSHHTKTVKVEKAKHVKRHKREKKPKRTKKKAKQKGVTQEKQAENQTASQQQTAGQQGQAQQNQQQPQTTPDSQQMASASNAQLPPSSDLHDFVNRYGESPAAWLCEHGMNQKQALDQLPDSMKSSGEMQTQFLLDQGKNPY